MMRSAHTELCAYIRLLPIATSSEGPSPRNNLPPQIDLQRYAERVTLLRWLILEQLSDRSF